MTTEWDQPHTSRVQTIEKFLQPEEDVFDSGIALDETVAERVGQRDAESILFVTDRRILQVQEHGHTKVSYLYPHVASHGIQRQRGVFKKGVAILTIRVGEVTLPFTGGATFLDFVASVLQAHAAKPHQYSKTVAIEWPQHSPRCGHCGYFIRQMHGYCSACACTFTGVIQEGDPIPSATAEDTIEIDPAN